MKEFIQFPNTPEEITAIAAKLREVMAEPLTLAEIIVTFEAWAAALSGRELDAIPGVAFLRLWLRRGTLEPMIARELGRETLTGGWEADGRAKLRPFPVGIVGHWPAGNIEIQPILSLTCGLLGGNAALVRVPSDLVEEIGRMVAPLAKSAGGEKLLRRIAFLSFDHSRQELQEAMA